MSGSEDQGPRRWDVDRWDLDRWTVLALGLAAGLLTFGAAQDTWTGGGSGSWFVNGLPARDHVHFSLTASVGATTIAILSLLLAAQQEGPRGVRGHRLGVVASITAIIFTTFLLAAVVRLAAMWGWTVRREWVARWALCAIPLMGTSAWIGRWLSTAAPVDAVPRARSRLALVLSGVLLAPSISCGALEAWGGFSGRND